MQLALAAAGKDKSALLRAQRKSEAVLTELVGLTLRQDLTPTQRTSLETCITVYMHQKEVRKGEEGCRGWAGGEWEALCRLWPDWIWVPIAA